MPLFDHKEKKIHTKIVYDGIPKSGKKTCLQYICKQIDEKFRSNITEKTLNQHKIIQFSFETKNKDFEGYSLHFHIYTFSGEVLYSANRQLLIKNADGIIFLVDSENNKFNENKSQLAKLKKFIDIEENYQKKIPVIFQYNKRDLANTTPIDYLENVLNHDNLSPASYQSIAYRGLGVIQTINALGNEIRDQLLLEKNKLKPV